MKTQMAVNFQDIKNAFDFVSSGQMFENEAYLNKETGEIFWKSGLGDDFEELPEDLDDEKYVSIPHKNELDLGKRLVLEFACQYLPEDVEEIKEIFRARGAYRKFKALLERTDMVEKWYEYEFQEEEKALRAWCEESEIETRG